MANFHFLHHVQYLLFVELGQNEVLIKGFNDKRNLLIIKFFVFKLHSIFLLSAFLLGQKKLNSVDSSVCFSFNQLRLQ